MPPIQEQGNLYVMPLDKKALLARKTKVQKPHELQLPSGDSVLLRVPTGKDYRDYRKYLRDEKGETIPARMALSDELMVATLLVNEDGTQMFTREEVMNSAMDEIIAVDLEAMKDEAIKLYGLTHGFKITLDEDREKNSSTTAPSV